jgi:hypothetical protein
LEWQEMATVLVLVGAAGMLRGCCGHTTAAALPMVLGAKQGQDMYLAGQMLPPPSAIRHACTEQRSCSHGAACQCTVEHGFSLIAMDRLPTAAVCIAAPDWFWFGLLFLLSIQLAVPSSVRTYRDHHTIFIFIPHFFYDQLLVDSCIHATPAALVDQTGIKSIVIFVRAGSVLPLALNARLDASHDAQ